MSANKQSSSQAAWAILTEGATSSRIQAHRLRHMINRVLKLVEVSDQKDHLYQVAGDLIMSVPSRLDALETDLDRTCYALSVLGGSFLRDRLPMQDRVMVDEAVQGAAHPFPKHVPRLSHRQASMARRVGLRYLVGDEPFNY